jgi:hypothetical protein
VYLGLSITWKNVFPFSFRYRMIKNYQQICILSHGESHSRWSGSATFVVKALIKSSTFRPEFHRCTGRGFGLVVRAAGWHISDPGSILSGMASIHLDVYPQRREHFWVDMCAIQKFLFHFFFFFFYQMCYPAINKM